VITDEVLVPLDEAVARALPGSTLEGPNVWHGEGVWGWRRQLILDPDLIRVFLGLVDVVLVVAGPRKSVVVRWSGPDRRPSAAELVQVLGDAREMSW
jgi:hypothetical protein